MASRKRPSLDKQLDKQKEPESAAKTTAKKTRKQEDKPTRQRTPSRAGKKAVSGFYDPQVSKQLRILGIEEDKSVQALLGEALNLLFEKYGKAAIASED